MVPPGEEGVKNPSWLNDPLLYHNRGDSTFAGESSQYGDFFGLDDLFTEHPAVVDGMVAAHQAMIDEFGIDGFRVDTVKHVNDEFWEAFGPAFETHAASLGKPDFFMFGEVFDSNPAFTSRFTTELPLDAVLDELGEHGVEAGGLHVGEDAAGGLLPLLPLLPRGCASVIEGRVAQHADGALDHR